MAKSCVTSDCVWSESSKFCVTMKGAGVPLDTKWPYLILYLRGIKDAIFLSEVQKARMHELLATIFTNKDFSHTAYIVAAQEVQSILTAPFSNKLDEIAREATALTNEVRQILGKQKQQVLTVSKNVDDGLAKGLDPADILSGLRDALKDIVLKMEHDSITLMELSYKDSLTGLANRRSFDAYLEETVETWQQSNLPAALIMFDIDHFKAFNDTYGHLVGDQVLATLAAQVKKIALALLEEDQAGCLLARYGGEEFAFILRGRYAKDAGKIAEQIRTLVASSSLKLLDAHSKVVQQGISVTVSLGVAPLWNGWTSAYQTNLVDFADKALYYAKNNGRNCVVEFSPENGGKFTILSPVRKEIVN